MKKLATVNIYAFQVPFVWFIFLPKIHCNTATIQWFEKRLTKYKSKNSIIHRVSAGGDAKPCDRCLVCTVVSRRSWISLFKTKRRDHYSTYFTYSLVKKKKCFRRHHFAPPSDYWHPSLDFGFSKAQHNTVTSHLHYRTIYYYFFAPPLRLSIIMHAAACCLDKMHKKWVLLDLT